MACVILVPWPVVEPMRPTVEAENPTHWTAQQFPAYSLTEWSLMSQSSMTTSHFIFSYIWALVSEILDTTLVTATP